MNQDEVDADIEAALAEATAATQRQLEAAQAAERTAQKEAPTASEFSMQSLAGVSAPLGFWDPAGFSKAPEGKCRFYREVELKHSRVAMLAAVGFPLAEQWHPLWGGNIEQPSYIAFQATPLQKFWPLVVGAVALVEIFSIFTFERPYDLFYAGSGGFWNIRSDHPPGDMGFDPLGLMPSDAAARLEMETKELNNGRLAMIAVAGMVVQELVTGEKLF